MPQYQVEPHYHDDRAEGRPRDISVCISISGETLATTTAEDPQLTCEEITLLNWTAILYSEEPTVLVLTEPEFLLVRATAWMKFCQSILQITFVEWLLRRT